MRFNNGYFGACICVLALLGTAIGGFVLNIEQDTRQVTRFDYIADISGLFSYTDAPEYINYNPSTNFVGYSSGDVIYSPSATVNNYRYVVNDGTSTSLVNTIITQGSDLGSDYAPWVDDAIIKVYNHSSVSLGSSDNPESFMPIFQSQHALVPTLASALNSLAPGYRSYASIDIDLTYSSLTSPVWFYGGSWERQDIEVGGSTISTYSADFTDSQLPDKITVNVASEQASAYSSGTLLWQENINNIGVFNKYWVSNSGDTINVTRNTQVHFEVSGISFPTYGYMQPSAGVKATSSQATWENGYENSVIDVKISKNGDVGTPYQGTHFEIGSDFGIDVTMSGNKISIYYGLVSDPSDWTLTNLGTWLAVQMRIDSLSGRIILTPTNDADLTRTVEPTSYSTILDGVLTPGTLTSFKVETANNGAMPSMKFQVTDTWVFLNTYNTVMIDPSIEVNDYFPSLTEYRLNFYSFAILGDSMTINGQVCPIDRDNGTITFENVAGFTFTKKLENFYLTYDTNVYITFVNDGSEYDLGTVTDEEVSFTGMWYFITGLYDPVTVNETFWNWNLGGFQASAGECLILFLGIIGAGIVVYTVFGRGKLGFLDWLVIIFAVFIGSCFLGF